MKHNLLYDNNYFMPLIFLSISIIIFDTNNLNYAHCNDDLNKNTNKNTNLIQKVQEKYSMNIQNSMNIDDSEYLDEYPVIEYMGKLFKEKQIDVYNNSDDVNMYYEENQGNTFHVFVMSV